MTPTLLRAVGEALYGEHWRAPLSRDLGVSSRTVERWDAGQNAIPVGVTSELHAILMGRLITVQKLERELAINVGS